MRDTYDADEVAVIEDKAYQVGVGIGEMNERKRIIALLESDGVLHDIWWAVYRDIEPFPKRGKLSQWEIAEVLKDWLIKGETK